MPQITGDFITGMFTTFRAMFQNVFFAAEAARVSPRFMLEVQSNTLTETYAWLGTVPAMRKWVDERQHSALNAYNYSLTNDHFEVTIDIDRDTFEDDRYGLEAPRIAQLGMEAPRFMEYTALTALDQGATAGNNSYDGVTFYNSAHVVGSAGAQTNIYSSTALTSNKDLTHLAADFAGAWAQMTKLKDDQNRPMSIVPDLVVCSPDLFFLFKQLLNSTFNPVGGIGSGTNVFQGVTDLVMSPYLAADTWHLLSTQYGAGKPLIFQNRKAPEFVGVNDPSSFNVFERRVFSYGVDTRFKVGYGMWELAVKVAAP